VEHIFAKLGISSRVQLTMLLREWLPRAREAADDQAQDQSQDQVGGQAVEPTS
jgi:hypothetical protein